MPKRARPADRVASQSKARRGNNSSPVAPVRKRGFWNDECKRVASGLSLPTNSLEAWPDSTILHARRRSDGRLRKKYAAVQLEEMPGFNDEGATRNARKRAMAKAKADGKPVKVTQAQFVLQLDEDQRRVYEKMAHAYRWAYNQGVAHYKTLGINSPEQWTKARGYEARKHVMNLAKTLSWAKTGYLAAIFQYGAEEFIKAADSSWALYKSKQWEIRAKGRQEPKKPVFRFRTKKEWTDRWRFSLPQRSCTLEGERIYITKKFIRKHWGLTKGAGVGELDRLRASFGSDGHPVSDFAICKLIGGDVVLRVTRYEQEIYTSTDTFAPHRVPNFVGGGIGVPSAPFAAHRREVGSIGGLPTGSDNQAAGSGDRVAVSLDPGKRTFLTGYMNGVGCGDVDVALNDRLLALRKRLLRLDAILAGKGRRKDKPTGRKRRNKLMGRRSLEARISNIVDDAHWKLAHWLCGVADDVVLGNFYIPGIVKGCLNGSVKWVLLRQRHCLFRQRLQHVASQYAGVKVHMQNEAYTSKTCTHCGKLNERLGASKIFVCPHCAMTFDRDGNAARNILIRWIVESTDSTSTGA
jgi:ribosomal protein L37AE/L43A